MAMDHPQALPSLDVWTSALLTKSTAGRGSNGKLEAYGIKKLRELILELAVRGKLVAQDPNDEPATKLLDRIDQVPKRMMRTRSTDDEESAAQTNVKSLFELPNGWEWIPFGRLPLQASVGIDRGRAQQGPDKAYAYFKMNNIGNVGGIDLSDLTRIDATPDEVETFALADGDFLFNTRNSRELVGKTCVFRGFYSGPVLYNNNILRAKFVDGLSPDFLDYWFRSPGGQAELEKLKSNTTNVCAIYQGKLSTFPCVIPPLAEQHRIVAKVDELMALCDQLEQQQTDSLAAHQTLVENLLGTLTRVESQQEFSAAWARIASHFDTLFTTEASIDQLKQTLLQLAVMGKLVPQDPDDEPASVLLKRIHAKRAKLIAEGEIKKDKLMSAFAEDEKPFELPQSWEWVCLSDLMPEFQNGVSSRGDKDGEPITVLRLADINNRRISLDGTRTIPINSRDIEKYKLLVGDILITRVNGSADIVGTFVLNDTRAEVIYCDHFIRMRISTQWINPSYLCLLGESPLVRNNIQSLFITTAGQKTVNQGHIGSLPIALPPLAEQHRIVAKVDELMSLCDALKARIKDAHTTQLHLADAIVEQTIG